MLNGQMLKTMAATQNERQFYHDINKVISTGFIYLVHFYAPFPLICVYVIADNSSL